MLSQVVSLTSLKLTNGIRGQSSQAPALLFIMGCHGNESTETGGASIIETVVGLVVGWELVIVKWSDSCTHKQRVRWSRREAEGLRERGRETMKRRIERGPGGER